MQRNIRKKRLIHASINDVWESISQSQNLEKWFMEGNFTAEESFTFEFLDVPGAKWKGVFYGEVISSQSPINLAYSWSHTKLKHTTYVWWKLDDLNGKTLVEIEHSGFKGLGDYLHSFFYSRFWKSKLQALDLFSVEKNSKISTRTKT